MAVRSSTSREVALIILAVACGCASSTWPTSGGPRPAPAKAAPPTPSPAKAPAPVVDDLLEDQAPFALISEADTSDCKAAVVRMNQALKQGSVCARDSDCEKIYGNCVATRRGEAREALNASISDAMKACKGSLMAPLCDGETTPVCVDQWCRVRRTGRSTP